MISRKLTPVWPEVFFSHCLCIRSVVYQQNSKESATLQPFFTLQLDIQSEKVRTVQEALETLVARESVQGYTSKSKQEVWKKYHMWMLRVVRHHLHYCWYYSWPAHRVLVGLFVSETRMRHSFQHFFFQSFVVLWLLFNISVYC